MLPAALEPTQEISTGSSRTRTGSCALRALRHRLRGGQCPRELLALLARDPQQRPLPNLVRRLARRRVELDRAQHLDRRRQARQDLGHGRPGAVAEVLAGLPATVEALGPIELDPAPGEAPDEVRERALLRVPRQQGKELASLAAARRSAARARRRTPCACGSTPWRSPESARALPVTSGHPRRRRPRRSVSVTPIRLFGDPVLRTRATEVTTFDAELRKLVADLTDTMPRPGRRGPRSAADRRRAARFHLPP